MKKLFPLLFLTLISCYASVAAYGQCCGPVRHPKDKIKATKTIKGTFKGFEVGDYIHAVITKTNGEEVSFYLPQNESVQYFLVAHKGEPLTLTYHVMSSYIEEAGGMQTIERLAVVKSGAETDAAWWKKQRTSSSVSKLRKKYDAMVDEARLNP
ncbi:MAG: hypothetical protein JOZ52_11685 [Acidobacteria bacterium]|nr:hypothetical protein [Acidobacteriota bacterium]